MTNTITHQQSWRTITTLLFIVGVGLGFLYSSASAQEKDSPKKVKNPFSKEDPKPQPDKTDYMTGVFLDISMTVRIEKMDDKAYKGTILTGQDLYPFQGKRKGDDLAGTFLVEKVEFNFSATIKGDVLLFRTAQREFKLPRRGTKLPNETQNPKLDPSKIVAPPAELQPKKAGTFDDYGRPQNRLWLKFGDRIFADYEIVHATPGKIPNVSRLRYQFDSIDKKSVLLNVSDYFKGTWNPQRKSTWLAGSRSLDSLGLTSGKRRVENLTVGESTLECKVSEYTFARGGENAVSLELEVWRCDKVNLPIQAVAIGPLALATESDMVAIRCKTNAGGLTTDTKFQVSELKKEAIVGTWKVNCVAFGGTTIVRRADGDFNGQYVKWISNEVPGGVVKHMETVRQGTTVHYRTQNLVAFGKTEAEGSQD